MATALPRDVTPMLATAGKLPEKDDGWAYEIKFDGVRVLTFVEKGQARLVTRNGNDVTSSYPEVADIAGALEGRSAILDGEVVVFDPKGRTGAERRRASEGARTCILDWSNEKSVRPFGSNTTTSPSRMADLPSRAPAMSATSG